MSLILGISGSPRRGGNSDALLDALLCGAASYGAETRAVRLRELSFSSCTGCEKCRKDKACTGLEDDMTGLYPAIQEARGLVLASPAHNYNVTALMKAFIDRLYCFYEFGDERPGPWSSRLAGQGRQAALIGVCEQPTVQEGLGGTMDMMRLPLEALGYQVALQLPVTGLFARGAAKKRPEILAQAEALGRMLAEATD